MNVVTGTLASWQSLMLQGKFTVKNIAIVRRYFERSEETPVPGVVLDMSGVSQLDSSAITILVNFQRRIIQKDGLLVLFGMRGDIAEIFSIVGIDKLFRICTDRDEFERLYGVSR